MCLRWRRISKEVVFCRQNYSCNSLFYLQLLVQLSEQPTSYTKKEPTFLILFYYFLILACLFKYSNIWILEILHQQVFLIPYLLSLVLSKLPSYCIAPSLTLLWIRTYYSVPWQTALSCCFQYILFLSVLLSLAKMSAALCIAAAFFVLIIARWVYNWRNPKCKGVLPPGSMGWPLLGETLKFFSPSTTFDVHPFVKERMKR